MTTIAYRDGVMAADTLATWGSSRDGAFTKIAKRGPYLAGVAGSVAACQRFLDWFATGLHGDPPEMPDGDRTSHGIIVTPDERMLTWGPTGWERVWIVGHYAMGSGGEFAQGALAMGATAEEAVQVAIQYDTKSGGEITVLRRFPGME